MRRFLIVLVGVVGVLALLAGLHHVVVVNAAGTAFAEAFQPTCSWCHGGAYSSPPADESSRLFELRRGAAPWPGAG